MPNNNNTESSSEEHIQSESPHTNNNGNTNTVTTNNTNNNTSNNHHNNKHHHHSAPNTHITPVHRNNTCACSNFHPNRSCFSFIAASFGRAFYLAYGLRAGLSLALHIIKLLRTQPKSLLSLKAIAGVNGLPLDAIELGLFIGGFTGLYNAAICAITRIRAAINNKNNNSNNNNNNNTNRPAASTVLAAGAIAGLSLLAYDSGSHRTIALYLFARVIQSIYNYQKAHGKWHLYGSDWKHGDTLLFSLCSAQVLYAYVMRPDTLPPSYLKFMIAAAPMHPIQLEAARMNNRSQPFNLEKVLNYCRNLRSTVTDNLYGTVESSLIPLSPINPLTGLIDISLPSMIPCTVMHPAQPFCTRHMIDTFIRAAKYIMPVYLSLTFVPMFILRFWPLLRHPFSMIGKGLFGTMRSTVFLATYVTSYMTMICAHRNLFNIDHRSLYFICGAISGLTVLIEIKSRRSELALYTLPRALDSLYIILLQRQWLHSIPNGELLLFCLSMSILMYFREFHEDCMSPALKKILSFFIPVNYNRLPPEPISPSNNDNNNQLTTVANNNNNGNNTSNKSAAASITDESVVSLGAGLLSPSDSNPSLIYRTESELQLLDSQRALSPEISSISSYSSDTNSNNDSMTVSITDIQTPNQPIFISTASPH